jgi:fructokinase
MFVVCGEALVDVFASTAPDVGLSLDGRVGGSPFNVAIGLARLGQPVGYFGTLSRDIFGQRLHRVLRSEGVRTDGTQRSDAPTTLSVVGLDEHGVPSYTFHGERGADRDLPQTALGAVPADARAFHFGSYSMLVEPVATTLRALVEREHRRRLIAYDPNVRLNVEASLERWREVLEWMAARAHLLKVSEEDLGLLYPGSAPRALAARWLAAGVALVIVTRGHAGAVAWTATAQATRPVRQVKVVDTVGAGDSFHAATLAWLAEHDALEPAQLAALTVPALESMLDFASLAAAITCSRQGAQLPRRAELDAA